MDNLCSFGSSISIVDHYFGIVSKVCNRGELEPYLKEVIQLYDNVLHLVRPKMKDPLLLVREANKEWDKNHVDTPVYRPRSFRKFRTARLGSHAH